MCSIHLCNVAYSICRGGGAGGMLPRKIWTIIMRVLVRPLETSITTQHLMQLEFNSDGSLYGPFSETLPLESAFVFEALPQNCFLGVADLSALCLQYMNQ